MTDEMLDKTVNADNLIEISKAEEEGTYAFKMVAKGVTRIFIYVGPSLYATPFLATFITNLSHNHVVMPAESVNPAICTSYSDLVMKIVVLKLTMYVICSFSCFTYSMYALFLSRIFLG